MYGISISVQIDMNFSQVVHIWGAGGPGGPNSGGRRARRTEFGGQAGRISGKFPDFGQIWTPGGPKFPPGIYSQKNPPNRRIYTSTRGATGGKIGDFWGSNSPNFPEFCQIFQKFPENFRNFGQI